MKVQRIITIAAAKINNRVVFGGLQQTIVFLQPEVIFRLFRAEILIYLVPVVVMMICGFVLKTVEILLRVFKQGRTFEQAKCFGMDDGKKEVLQDTP